MTNKLATFIENSLILRDTQQGEYVIDTLPISEIGEVSLVNSHEPYSIEKEAQTLGQLMDNIAILDKAAAMLESDFLYVANKQEKEREDLAETLRSIEHKLSAVRAYRNLDVTGLLLSNNKYVWDESSTLTIDTGLSHICLPTVSIGTIAYNIDRFSGNGKLGDPDNLDRNPNTDNIGNLIDNNQYRYLEYSRLDSKVEFTLELKVQDYVNAIYVDFVEYADLSIPTYKLEVLESGVWKLIKDHNSDLARSNRSTLLFDPVKPETIRLSFLASGSQLIRVLNGSKQRAILGIRNLTLAKRSYASEGVGTSASFTHNGLVSLGSIVNHSSTEAVLDIYVSTLDKSTKLYSLEESINDFVKVDGDYKVLVRVKKSEDILGLNANSYKLSWQMIERPVNSTNSVSLMANTSKHSLLTERGVTYGHEYNYSYGGSPSVYDLPNVYRVTLNGYEQPAIISGARVSVDLADVGSLNLKQKLKTGMARRLGTSITIDYDSHMMPYDLEMWEHSELKEEGQLLIYGNREYRLNATNIRLISLMDLTTGTTVTRVNSLDDLVANTYYVDMEQGLLRVSGNFNKLWATYSYVAKRKVPYEFRSTDSLMILNPKVISKTQLLSEALGNDLTYTVEAPLHDSPVSYSEERLCIYMKDGTVLAGSVDVSELYSMETVEVGYQDGFSEFQEGSLVSYELKDPVEVGGLFKYYLDTSLIDSDRPILGYGDLYSKTTDTPVNVGDWQVLENYVMVKPTEAMKSSRKAKVGFYYRNTSTATTVKYSVDYVNSTIHLESPVVNLTNRVNYQVAPYGIKCREADLVKFVKLNNRLTFNREDSTGEKNCLVYMEAQTNNVDPAKKNYSTPLIDYMKFNLT